MKVAYALSLLFATAMPGDPLGEKAKREPNKIGSRVARRGK